jgi:hypothetical protein
MILTEPHEDIFELIGPNEDIGQASCAMSDKRSVQGIAMMSEVFCGIQADI